LVKSLKKRAFEELPFPKGYKKYCDNKIDKILTKINKNSTILDAGCGGYKHKYSFLKLLEKFPLLSGCDLNSTWHPKIKKENILSLTYENNSFDIVLCLNVIEHLPDWNQGLRELIRVARKKVIITVPTSESKIFTGFLNIIRKIIGIHNKIMVGHYLEFTPEMILKLTLPKIKTVEFEPLVSFGFPLFPKFFLKKEFIILDSSL